jgi:hypothetical protein
MATRKQEVLAKEPENAGCQSIKKSLSDNDDTSNAIGRRRFAAKTALALTQECGIFLTPAEAAIRWRFHVETVRLWLRQRKLTSVILARRRLIPLAEIQRIESSGLIQRAE